MLCYVMLCYDMNEAQTCFVQGEVERLYHTCHLSGESQYNQQYHVCVPSSCEHNLLRVLDNSQTCAASALISRKQATTLPMRRQYFRPKFGSKTQENTYLLRYTHTPSPIFIVNISVYCRITIME